MLSDKARHESPQERLVELKRKRHDLVLVHEVYASIQGESSHAGRPCVFVRTTGCHLRCTWCDTEHSFHVGSERSVDSLVDEVRALSIPLVELTGGEPLLQKSVLLLVTRLLDAGLEVLIETSGGVSIHDVDARAKLIVDVKAPASGEEASNVWTNVPLLVPGKDELKFVLANESDYQWAKRALLERGIAPNVTVLFSPAWPLLAPAVLAEWIVRDRLPVRLQVQLHKVLWGERPGV